MSKIRIAFCYNTRKGEVGEMDARLDYDSAETVRGIQLALERNGASVIGVEADDDAFDNLKKMRGQIDLVFNISEGTIGDARESQIPIFCEMLNIPYTHSSPTTHAISLNKQLTKLAVMGMGFDCPKAVVVRNCQIEKKRIHFPVLIKPNGEGSSCGVFAENVADSWEGVNQRIDELRKGGLKGNLLVEEYVDGREFTVAVLGNPLRVMPIIEQRFDFLPKGMNKIAGYELKWIYEDRLKDLTQAYYCPPELSDSKIKEIERITLGVCEGLGVRDCARLDFRMDASGKIYFIEINTLPGIIPDENVISYFPLSCRAVGLSYTEMVGEILRSARKRYLL